MSLEPLDLDDDFIKRFVRPDGSGGYELSVRGMGWMFRGSNLNDVIRHVAGARWDVEQQAAKGWVERDGKWVRAASVPPVAGSAD